MYVDDAILTLSNMWTGPCSGLLLYHIYLPYQSMFIPCPIPTPLFLSKCAHFSQVLEFSIILFCPHNLQKPTKKDGLGLPVFQHEYWAHNSKAWGFWNQTVAGLKHLREMSRIESSNVLSPTGASLSAILNLIYSSNCKAAILCSSLTILREGLVYKNHQFMLPNARTYVLWSNPCHF